MTAHGETQEAPPIRIVGLGGSLRRPSNSLSALKIALNSAKRYAITDLISAADLAFPFYDPQSTEDALPSGVERMLDHIRRADGLLLSAPTYHGCMSGLIKNALDYLEYLRSDDPPYLGRKPVGIITVGGGITSVVRAYDGIAATIQALRGMTLPVIAPLFLGDQNFDAAGNCTDLSTEARLGALAEEVVRFARRPALPVPRQPDAPESRF